MTQCNCPRKNSQTACRIFNVVGMQLVLFANASRIACRFIVDLPVRINEADVHASC